MAVTSAASDVATSVAHAEQIRVVPVQSAVSVFRLFRSTRDTSGGEWARSPLPEHGQHRSHENNTAKPIELEAACRAGPDGRLCVVQSKHTKQSPLRRPPSHTRSRSVLFPCNPRFPCSGCFDLHVTRAAVNGQDRHCRNTDITDHTEATRICKKRVVWFAC